VFRYTHINASDLAPGQSKIWGERAMFENVQDTGQSDAVTR